MPLFVEIYFACGPCPCIGVELRTSPNGLDLPSNLKGTVVAKGAGLRASVKALESPPDPTVNRATPLAVTFGVMGQKSANGIVAKCLP